MKKAILFLFSVLLFTSYIYAKGSKETPEEFMMMTDDNSQGSVDSMKAENRTENDYSMMMAADMAKPPFDLSGLAPAVIPFTSEEYAMMLAKDKTVIYFFAASWCPTCKTAYSNIKADYKMIPADTVIIMVNYDTENGPGSKYGVTFQHTFVTIDSEGTKKNIWTGSDTVKDILAKAKSM